MARNQDRIPQAWARGEYAAGGALVTDGETLMSYGHIIGITQIHKTAYDCRYSVTTARHANGAKRVAHRTITPCPTCNPNLPHSQFGII